MFTKKKTLAFIVLLAVTAPILFFSGFLVKQLLIQHEMEEKLETASLQTISIDVTAIQWLKKNKEAVIDGKSFDVKTYNISGNKIILTGLFDDEEDNLNNQLKDFIQQKNGANDPSSSTVIKFLFPPLYNNTAASTDQLVWQNVPHHFMPYKAEKVVEKYLSSDIPPPRFI
jgi:hypothetical protein